MDSPAAVAVTSPELPLLVRHQFLIKRLFSLTGLFFSGYVVVHLLTNASLFGGVAMFQSNVNRIHSLGPALPIVEWVFLFIPIIFHSFVGWMVIAGAAPNLSIYRYSSNIRYTLQRVTAIILFFFIIGHVLHMHHMGSYFGLGFFRAEQAASSLASSLQSALWIQLFYSLGVLSAAFHLGNGLWTAGIAWGLWTTPAAQARANYIAVFAGVLVAVTGMLAIVAARNVDVEQAIVIEKNMEYFQRGMQGEVPFELPKEPLTSH